MAVFVRTFGFNPWRTWADEAKLNMMMVLNDVDDDNLSVDPGLARERVTQTSGFAIPPHRINLKLSLLNANVVTYISCRIFASTVDVTRHQV